MAVCRVLTWWAGITFPRTPFPYGSGLELAEREICTRFRWEWSGGHYFPKVVVVRGWWQTEGQSQPDFTLLHSVSKPSQMLTLLTNSSPRPTTGHLCSPMEAGATSIASCGLPLWQLHVLGFWLPGGWLPLFSNSLLDASLPNPSTTGQVYFL